MIPVTDVVVIGSLNCDLVVTVPRLPAPGETTAGSPIERRCGGKGANQAIAASRLGARVRLVGLVGDDDLGVELRSAVAAHGVDVTQVRVLEGAASGTALVLVEEGGENMIVISPGANGSVTPRRLGGSAGLGAILDGADALLMQLEIPLATCSATAEAARERGVHVVLNAAPSPLERSPEVEHLLALTDVLIVNEAEAVALVGAPDPAVLRTLGPRTAVVTMGSRGASAHNGRRRIDTPGFTVPSLDTVGAGDAFCGQFALAHAARVPLDDALRRACAAGAITTTTHGAQAPSDWPGRSRNF